MKKFSSIPKLNNISTITIGKFDSMHLAHNAILNRLGKDGIILVIKMKTLKDSSIIPHYKKEKYALNAMYYIDFHKIKNLSGKKFIKYLKSKLPNLKTIVVGCDFRFGKNRKSGIEDITKENNLNVVVLEEMQIDGIPIHSSFIRNFILNGDLENANKLLGRHYSIEGNVIKGQGRGESELFPTLNIIANDYLLPKDGVYITYTRIESSIYQSISFIGNRLSTDMSFAIETHIINKIIPTPKSEIEIFFFKRIRDNKKFLDLSSLKKQIQIDINEALIFFGKKDK